MIGIGSGSFHLTWKAYLPVDSHHRSARPTWMGGGRQAANEEVHSDYQPTTFPLTERAKETEGNRLVRSVVRSREQKKL